MVLRDTAESRIAFAYGAITLCGWPFRPLPLTIPICNSLRASQGTQAGLQHHDRNGCDLSRGHGLGFRFRSPLLTEYFLLLEVLRCFSSLGYLDRSMYSSRPYPGVTPGGFPHSDISGSKLARSSRSISLPATSFIGSRRQGIHRTPSCSLTYISRVQHEAGSHASVTSEFSSTKLMLPDLRLISRARAGARLERSGRQRGHPLTVVRDWIPSRTVVRGCVLGVVQHDRGDR